MSEMLRTVANPTLHFGPWGLGGAMPAERCLELLNEEMAALPLPAEVPAEVSKQWDSLKELYREGLFSYQSFTRVEREAPRILEVALKVRFLEHYRREIPVVVEGVDAIRVVRTFDDVDALFRGRIEGKSVSLAGHPRFNASLTSLLKWARAERYLYGQRNRVREEMTVLIRNHLQHSEFDLIVAPPDALRTMSEIHQMIRRLWCHDTAGRDAYPGPARRSPWVVGFGPREGEGTWFPIDLIPEADTRERENRTWFVVMATDREHPLDWQLGFEVTATPIDPLWGPGSWDAMVDAVSQQGDTWGEDEVEVLDRVFYIRVRNGVVEPSRSEEQLMGLASASGDRWYVVRADDPRAAAAHVNRLAAGICNRIQGWCSNCARDGIHVDGLLASSQRDTVVTRFIKGVAPGSRHPLRVAQI
jgi:hypothetical protein